MDPRSALDFPVHCHAAHADHTGAGARHGRLPVHLEVNTAQHSRPTRRIHLSCGPLLATALPETASARTQSALDARGTDAQAILELTWVLIIGAGVIMLLVVALIGYALLAAPERRRWLGRASAIVAGGIVFPVITLSALLVYGLMVSGQLIAAHKDALRIEVIGEQWWWRVRYFDEQGVAAFETANELRIPVGRPVELALRSRDVIHSFWVPQLAGKMDMIPGRVNRLRIQANDAGIYRGQCAEYCGGPHALMAFHVVAEPAENYVIWERRQREPAPVPTDPWLRSGHDLFMHSGCIACHAIRGTQALASNGPDLTHVGSRLWLAAGNFPNHPGTLAGWIADSQRLKPGNHMPAFPVFMGVELRALTAYLESLR
ncbi:MAG: cytochrome c oxidase subunit II [Burkholderiales bacterium]|nr:cytochrome c oxidase subunit II [Burkholderiales bacterium]